MTLVLKKTDLGLAEIARRSDALNLTERRVLILLDGKRSVTDAELSLGSDSSHIIGKLLNLGLVENVCDVVTIRPLPTESYVWQKGFYADSGKEAAVSNAQIDVALNSGFASEEVKNGNSTSTVEDPSSTSVVAGKSFLTDFVVQILGHSDNILRSHVDQISDSETLQAAYKLIVLHVSGLVQPRALKEFFAGYARAIAQPSK